MGSKSHSSNQRGHFENIAYDRRPELLLTKLVRYFGVSVFQGQPGELHVSLQCVTFQETQFWSKLVVEKGSVSMRSCAEVCLLTLPRPNSSPTNSLQFTEATKPALMEPTSPNSYLCGHLQKKFLTAGYRCLDLLISAARGAVQLLWSLGYRVGLEMQQRCTR